MRVFRTSSWGLSHSQFERLSVRIAGTQRWIHTRIEAKKRDEPDCEQLPEHMTLAVKALAVCRKAES